MRGLVLCFRPRPRAHVICSLRLKTTSFVSFILFLLRVFTGKKCVAEAIMLNMDDTLDEEALIIFEELEVQN